MKIEALVLAAGAGRRFGGAKLLALYRGRPVLHGALEAALASPAGRVLLVTGHEAAAIEQAAEDFRRSGDPAGRLSSVRADMHLEGLGASVREGARGVAPDTEAVLLFLADMPRVPHKVAAALIEALVEALGEAPSGTLAAAPLCRGRRGHPVLVTRGLLPALLAASGDEGARGALQGLGPRLRLVPWEDDGVLFDVDHPADLSR